jgi:hypothetical protein
MRLRKTVEFSENQFFSRLEIAEASDHILRTQKQIQAARNSLDSRFALDPAFTRIQIENPIGVRLAELSYFELTQLRGVCSAELSGPNVGFNQFPVPGDKFFSDPAGG